MKKMTWTIIFLLLIGVGVFFIQQKQEENVQKANNQEELTFTTQSAKANCPKNINAGTDFTNFTKHGYLPTGVTFHERVENKRTGTIECHYKDPNSGARIPGKLLLRGPM